ncbi:MAG: right-handed parallel beta-helix repeat-containing protein [Thermoplasmata archaeon]
MKNNGKAGLVLTALAISLLMPSVPASNDPPPSGGTVTGNWTVTDARTYTGVSILLDHGNLTVASGGSLTLDHVSLRLRLDTSGQFGIEVQSGGKLVVRNGSTISSTNASNRYLFRIRPGASVTLSGSTLSDVGYTYTNSPSENNGVYVASENVTIDSCTFINSTHGVYLDGVSPSVTSCGFFDIASAGIMAYGASPVVNGCEFTRCYYGVYSYFSSPTVSSSSFTDCRYGVYMYGHSRPKVHNCTFQGSGYFGTYCAYYASPDIEDCTFVRNGLLSSSYGGAAYYGQMTSGGFRRNKVATPDLGYGIQLTDGCRPVVEQCEISTHSRPAVSVTSYGAVEIVESAISTGDSYAIYAEHYSYVALSSCEVTARSYGIYLYTAQCSLNRTNLTSTAGSGAILYYTSFISADNCTIYGDQLGMYVLYYGSEAVLNRTTLGGRSSIGLYLSGSLATLHNSSVYSIRSNAIYTAGDSRLTAVNSTITSSAPGVACIYIGGPRNELDLTNTFFDQSKVTFTEPTSVLHLSWFLTAAVQWQNAAPAPGARVRVTDSSARLVFETETGERGECPTVPVRQYSRSQLTWQNFTPHEISAVAGGVRRSERKSLTTNTVIRLTLADPDPPLLCITHPRDGLRSTTGHIRAEGTAEDYASGLNRVEYAVDDGNWSRADGLDRWSFDLDLLDGRHLLKVRAFDRAGMSSVAAASILVDTELQLRVESPEEGALVNKSPVRVSGVAEPMCCVTVNGLPAEVDPEGNFEALVELGEGPQTLTVVAVDEAGNTAVETRNVTVDTVEPALMILSPAQGHVTSSRVVTINGQTEQGAFVTVGGLPAIVGPDGVFSAQVPLREGNNTIQVTAADAAGNLNSTTLLVILDTVPPHLVILHPSDGSLTNRPLLTVSGESDGVEVTAGATRTSPVEGRFSLQLQLEEGPNHITLRAVDAAGNANQTHITVTLDTIPPFVQLVHPRPGFVTNNAALTVSIVTEPGAEVTVNGLPATNTGGRLSVPIRLSPGLNTLTVRAVDGATNAAFVNTTVELDQVPPPLVISSPQSGFRTSQDTVMVRGYTDPGSSVTVNGILAQIDSSGRFACEIPLQEGENSLVLTAVDRAGNPTTKLLRITRTGPLSLSKEETPLLFVGLGTGLVAGAVAGYLTAMRRKRREEAVAPLEPSIGRYNVEAIGEDVLEQEVPAPAQPTTRPFPPHSETLESEEWIPSVPAAESAPHMEPVPPMPRMEKPEELSWEEEAPHSREGGRGEPGVKRVEELLRRLR